MYHVRAFFLSIVFALALWVPSAAQQVCNIVYNGNEGTQHEFSVRMASWHLDQANALLPQCAYVDGPPWQACRQVDQHLNLADLSLVQVFTVAARVNCWVCDPGNRSNPNTLIGQAQRLAQVSRWYESNSRQDRSYENTVFMIERWLDAHPVYCEICGDGVDNDRDGLPDCKDPDCAGTSSCPEICDDGADNDGDGRSDCDDPDCASDPGCTAGYRERDCNDGDDNDGDGWVDCDDLDCTLACKWVVYVNKDEYTCCKGDPFLKDRYPHAKADEAPHPLRIGQRSKIDAGRAQVLRGGFDSKEDATSWVCSHPIQRTYNFTTNVARIAGVLVSNTPCPPTID
jgi:hypothetical protein